MSGRPINKQERERIPEEVRVRVYRQIKVVKISSYTTNIH